jgi:hypothetical protein
LRWCQVAEHFDGRDDLRDVSVRDAVDVIANLLFSEAARRVRRVTVANEGDAIPATLALADGRIDAELRLHPAHDDLIDA